MAQLYLDLKCETDPEWINVVFSDWNYFLKDHANCERKASAMAMSFVAKYPDRAKIIDPLIELAIEELEHFREVYQILEERGLQLKQKFDEDRYVKRLQQLARDGKDERFLDRLLISSVVETRGAERFKIVYHNLEEGPLKKFYHKLWADDAKHSNVFVELALNYFEETIVYDRLQKLMEEEAQIIQELELIPAMH